MSNLLVQVTDGDDAGLSVDVPARIENLGRYARNDVREVIVKAGAQPTTITLEPGTYNVQVVLPTGQRMQRVVVVDEHNRERVVLDAGRARGAPYLMRTRSGSYQLKGNPAGLARGSAVSSGSAIRRSMGEARRVDPVAGPRARGPGVATRTGAPREIKAPKLTAIPSSPLMWSRAISPEAFVQGGEPLGEEQIQLVSKKGRWRYVGEPQRESVGNTRYWLQTGRGKVQKLISMPIPWTDEHAPDDQVQIELIRESGLDNVRLVDPKLGSLLTYLGNGQLRAARPLLDDQKAQQTIMSAVYHKYRSPLAACAGAYVGLSSEEPALEESWPDWLANLAESFQRIPDAQIIYARWLLIRPVEVPDPDEVFSFLNRAFQAGLPFYTVGMQLLQDMLTLVSGDVPPARDLLAEVTSVNRQIDPRQLFLTLDYGRS